MSKLASLHNREYVSQVSIILTNAIDKSTYQEGKFLLSHEVDGLNP